MVFKEATANNSNSHKYNTGKGVNSLIKLRKVLISRLFGNESINVKSKLLNLYDRTNEFKHLTEE